ncbi:MAG TPA: CBS domain-containing protein [Thermodesulfobacteriota bacterium]|nr:CBS domain-containing protein [Thermodesulfobacteriota bacterium]
MIENIKIKEIMTTDVMTVHENENLSVVAKIFRESPIHHVPVLKGKRPVGIISTQDLFKLIFDFDSTDTRMLDTLLDHTYKIKDVMSNKLVVFEEESMLKDAAKILSDSSLHSIMIVNSKGDLTGIVTTTDLMRFLYKNIE